MAIFGKENAADRFEQLAQIVDLGLANFRKMGGALKEIADKELYKSRYRSFETCCRERWKISASHAYRLIDAYNFCEELSPTDDVPTSHNQIRRLDPLPKEQRVDAWREAAAEGGTPAAIDAAVKKRRPRKGRKPKPIRLRSAGAWVTIEPTRKFVSVELTLTEILNTLREQTRDAA